MTIGGDAHQQVTVAVAVDLEDISDEDLAALQEEFQRLRRHDRAGVQRHGQRGVAAVVPARRERAKGRWPPRRASRHAPGQHQAAGCGNRMAANPRLGVSTGRAAAV